MNRPALKGVAEPSSSVARQKLADAIVKRDQAAKVITACDGALTELRAETSETKHELRKAETEITEAERRRVDGLVSKHLGQGSKPGSSAADARRHAENLKETLDNLDSARSQLEQKLEKARLDHHDAKHAVATAIQGVVADETITMVNDHWILRNLYETQVNLFRHVLLGLGVEQQRAQTNPVIDTALINHWKLALGSLEKDADAELPT